MVSFFQKESALWYLYRGDNKWYLGIFLKESALWFPYYGDNKWYALVQGISVVVSLQWRQKIGLLFKAISAVVSLLAPQET